MARPAKDAKAKDSATVVVNIDDFVRTRDSVVTGLATLQSAVQDLSRAYIAHTNTVLGRAPGTSLDLLAIGNPLDSTLLAARPISPATKDAEEPKKKRKRAPHDPNAPKRALTPYFLYMQTARSKIAQELGASAKPKDVADEGTRRWGNMTDAEKQTWHKQYQTNLDAYREKMKAYKAGKAGIPVDPQLDVTQQLLAEQDTAAAAGEEEEEEEEEEPTPEPPKAPTPPRASQAKRRKTAAEPKAAPAPAAPSPAVTKKDAEKAKSPEKKKKSSKKEKEAEAEKAKKAEAAKAAEATPSKEKKGRKKRKSEAISE